METLWDTSVPLQVKLQNIFWPTVALEEVNTNSLWLYKSRKTWTMVGDCGGGRESSDRMKCLGNNLRVSVGAIVLNSYAFVINDLTKVCKPFFFVFSELKYLLHCSDR